MGAEENFCKNAYQACLKKDLCETEKLFNRIQNNEELFFRTLSDIFELAAALPMCENEYEDDAEQFKKYEKIRMVLREFRSMLETYGARFYFAEES